MQDHQHPVDLSRHLYSNRMILQVTVNKVQLVRVAQVYQLPQLKKHCIGKYKTKLGQRRQGTFLPTCLHHSLQIFHHSLKQLLPISPPLKILSSRHSHTLQRFLITINHPKYNPSGQQFIIINMGQSSTTLPKNADINHPTLKQCMISEVGRTMLFDCSVSNKAEYENWVAQLGKLYSEHPDTLLFPISYSYEGVGVCGEGGIVHIQYPLYALPLREELRKRVDTGKYFTERELWYLLYSLVSACVSFKSLNKKVGDIQPLNIFVNQENGFVKVANACSWPGATTNYEKVIFQHEVAYLAPEEVKEAKQGRVDTQVDPYIAESFSIGVTMLEAALLRSSMDLYTEKKNCFSYSLLEKVLKEFKNLNLTKQKGSYSEELKAAIIGLCEISPEIRVTSEQIYKWLYPYHQPILNLNPFKPGFPPIQEQKSQPRISPLPYTTMTISKYKFGVQSSEVQSRIEKSSPKFMEEKKTSPESIKKYKPNLSNDDFLKHIDEQLRISKQTHK